MATPLTFAYHVGENLVLNGVEIYQDTLDAVISFEDGDYQGFGVSLGKVLYLLFSKEM